MIRILLACRDSIPKSPEKAGKIKDLTVRKRLLHYCCAIFESALI